MAQVQYWYPHFGNVADPRHPEGAQEYSLLEEYYYSGTPTEKVQCKVYTTNTTSANVLGPGSYLGTTVCTSYSIKVCQSCTHQLIGGVSYGVQPKYSTISSGHVVCVIQRKAWVDGIKATNETRFNVT